MPTENPRVTITISEELHKELKNYQYTHRMKNQTQTLVALLEKGLNSFQGNIKKEAPAPEGAEADGISYDEALQIAVAFGLPKEGVDLSEDDFAFLAHVAGLMDYWVSSKRK